MLYEPEDVDLLAREAGQLFVAAGRAPDPAQRMEHRREALKLADRLWARQRGLANISTAGA